MNFTDIAKHTTDCLAEKKIFVLKPNAVIQPTVHLDIFEGRHRILTYHIMVPQYCPFCGMKFEVDYG